nr:hypothetical protein [Anaplasma phagocytophilum]
MFVAAGLLAKTIEGGEVVEIRAVSSTSVMINFCDGLNFGYAGYFEVLGSYTART